jgi:hypothetical protein
MMEGRRTPMLLPRTARTSGRGGSTEMNGPETATIISSPSGRACLVEGCSCKDARIVSFRRAAYFASIAQTRGETANRVISADSTWASPQSLEIELLDGVA